MCPDALNQEIVRICLWRVMDGQGEETICIATAASLKELRFAKVLIMCLHLFRPWPAMLDVFFF